MALAVSRVSGDRYSGRKKKSAANVSASLSLEGCTQDAEASQPPGLSTFGSGEGSCHQRAATS